jgi:hypothetical protein
MYEGSSNKTVEKLEIKIDERLSEMEVYQGAL